MPAKLCCDENADVAFCAIGLSHRRIVFNMVTNDNAGESQPRITHKGIMLDKRTKLIHDKAFMLKFAGMSIHEKVDAYGLQHGDETPLDAETLSELVEIAEQAQLTAKSLLDAIKGE